MFFFPDGEAFVIKNIILLLVEHSSFMYNFEKLPLAFNLDSDIFDNGLKSVRLALMTKPLSRHDRLMLSIKRSLESDNDFEVPKYAPEVKV